MKFIKVGDKGHSFKPIVPGEYYCGRCNLHAYLAFNGFYSHNNNANKSCNEIIMKNVLE